MGMVVRTNTMALNAYRQLGMNNSAVTKSLEKLSSGFRINRAGDDAAGLAISEKMKAQITGLETASANAQDGISLIQTAEGNLNEVHSMLNRMVELATKSANGTYTSTERKALQDEVDQLLDEINRISQSANFNGTKLLDGSLDTTVKTTGNEDVAVTVVADGQLGKTPQAGVFTMDFSNTTITASEDAATVTLTAFGNNPMEITLAKKGDTLSGAELAQKFADEWNKAGNQYTNLWFDTHGFNMTASVEGDKLVFTMDSAPTAAWTQSAATGSLTYADSTGNNAEEVTVTVQKEAVDSTMTRMYGQASFELSTTAGAGKIVVEDGSTVTIGDETYVFAVGPDSKYKGVANVIDLTDKTATAADLVKIAAQRLSTAAEGNGRFKVGTTLTTGVITVTEKEGGVDYAKNNLAGTDGKGTKGKNGTKDATSDNWAGLIKTGKVDDAAMGKALTLQIGDTAEDFNKMSVSVADMSAKGLGLDGLSIMTEDSASKAIDTIKNAINSVSTTRAGMGALQNRLEHTINNLDVAVENLSAANSRIRDTDMAKEMMNYTKMNVLVQSAQAMLAQANQQPQSVLQLLQ